MSLLAFKEAYWFPKLSVGVGRRTWSYDGEVEETYDAIIENASGGPPLRTWNCGSTGLTDAEIDTLLRQMGETDYTTDEYDFFFRSAKVHANRHCVLGGLWVAPLDRGHSSTVSTPLTRGYLLVRTVGCSHMGTQCTQCIQCTLGRTRSTSLPPPQEL